jgi:hypothetical protein
MTDSVVPGQAYRVAYSLVLFSMAIELSPIEIHPLEGGRWCVCIPTGKDGLVMAHALAEALKKHAKVVVLYCWPETQACLHIYVSQEEAIRLVLEFNLPTTRLSWQSD